MTHKPFSTHAHAHKSKILFWLCHNGVLSADWWGKNYFKRFEIRLQHDKMWNKWKGLRTFSMHCITKRLCFSEDITSSTVWDHPNAEGGVKLRDRGEITLQHQTIPWAIILERWLYNAIFPSVSRVPYEKSITLNIKNLYTFLYVCMYVCLKEHQWTTPC